MALDNLRDFLGAIDAAGQLVRIGVATSVDKEITEIADRCMKSPGGGPALLFERPTLMAGGASPYPVAVNLFGSERRMALALGVERLDEVGERIADLLHLKVPDGLLGKLAMLPKLAEVAKFPPKTVGGGGGGCRARRSSFKEVTSTFPASRCPSAGQRTAAPTSRWRA